MVIGTATHCIVCREPGTTCVMPYVCWSCQQQEREDAAMPEIPLPPEKEPAIDDKGQIVHWVGKNQSANDSQVGGDHYRDVPGEQHWDRLIRLWGWPRAKVYFVGQATKYLERHEKKNGLQDLKKAAHFCQKIVEEEEKYQLSLGKKEDKT